MDEDDDYDDQHEVDESSFIPDKRKKPKRAPTTLSTHRSPKNRVGGGDDVAPVSQALKKLDVHDDELEEEDEEDEEEVEDVAMKSKSKGSKKEKVEREKSKGSKKEKVEREKSKGSNKEKVEKDDTRTSPKKEKVFKDHDTPTSPKKEKTVKFDTLTKKEKPVKADTPVSPKKEKPVKADTPVSPKKEKPVKADKAATPKSPKKEKEEKAVNVPSDGVPPKLVKKVMELGMEPLYAYLLEKLDAFKENDRYKNNAEDWGLIKMAPGKYPAAEDLALITPEQLYASFMFTSYSDGADDFQAFLMYNCEDRLSWGCMANFEQMKNESTSYVDFKALFKDAVEALAQLPAIAEKYPKKVAALQELYGKCEDLDLKAAWKKF